MILLLGLTAQVTLALVLAQAVEMDLVGYILNYGVLGIATLALVTGRVYTKAHVDALNARISSLEAIVAAFQRTTKEQTLPALARFADVLESPEEQRRAAAEGLGDLDRLLTRLEDRLNEGGGR